MKMLSFAALAAVIACSALPARTWACACGCDVFDVGGETMMPMRKGGEVFLEYDYQDQRQNWSGSAKAPGANNSDQDIRTNFITATAQYTFNAQWTLVAQVPIWDRTFSTENIAGTAVESFNHSALGDIRLMGVYTGLSKDMSMGLIGGVKLATGDRKYRNFDPDTQIGTGSTNLLIGAYKTGSLSRDGIWGYFAQALWDVPVASQGGYRPGQEIDGALGVSYHATVLADGGLQVSPLFQILASNRDRDAGPVSEPENTGYSRLMLSPGVQLTSGDWSFYGDVEIPVYQHVNGNQLIAPQLFKVVLGRHF